MCLLVTCSCSVYSCVCAACVHGVCRLPPAGMWLRCLAHQIINCPAATGTLCCSVLLCVYASALFCCRRTTPYISAWLPSGPARTSAGTLWRQGTGRTRSTGTTAHSSSPHTARQRRQLRPTDTHAVARHSRPKLRKRGHRPAVAH